MRTLSIATAAVSLLLFSAPASAQGEQDRSFAVQLFRPALDADGLLSIEGSRTPGPFRWNVGLHLHYAHEPLMLVEEETDQPVAELVAYSLTMDYAFAIGIGRRLELGVGLPVAVSQDGDLGQIGDEGETLSAVGFGDLRIAAKWSLIDNTADGPGLGLIVSGTLPIGDQNSFLGDKSFTLDPRIVADFKLLDVIAVAANVGFRYRHEESKLTTLTAGNEILFGGGLRAPVALRGKLALLIEYFGATAAAGLLDPTTTPMELDAGARLFVGDIALQALGGVGIGQGYGTPTFRVGSGITWAPRTHDSDNDGLEDESDMCARIAEDGDGFEDDDGCPESDNDRDGVYDYEDRCANEAFETGRDADGDGCTDPDSDGDGVADAADRCDDGAEDRDGHQDDDGCPDPDNDGDSIPDASDRCPGEAEDRDEHQDDDGCPDPDNDGDSILDASDRCPGEPEDRDQYQDDDGCPDPDNDSDGVLDEADRCPAGGETINGVDDDDGCADRGGRTLVSLEDGRLRVRGTIGFDAQGAVSARSRSVLDQLAMVLIANQALRVRVTGPDGEGSAERAAALRTYLTGHGVQAARIEVAAAPQGGRPQRTAAVSVVTP